MFERYNIVSDGDLDGGAVRLSGLMIAVRTDTNADGSAPAARRPPSVLSVRLIMKVRRENRARTFHGDSSSLFDCKGMIGRFELDEGSLPVIS